MPVKIHRNDKNEWLMLFCIHPAIFKTATLLQKFASRSEWQGRREEINLSAVWLHFFSVYVEEAAVKLQCFTSHVFIATLELRGEGSTKTVMFFHALHFVSALPPAFLWAAEHRIHSRAALLPLCLRSRGGCGVVRYPHPRWVWRCDP